MAVLLTIVIVLVLVALGVYALDLSPISDPFKRLIQTLIVLIGLVYLAMRLL